MKLKFKDQNYQTLAVDSVVDCFAGQPKLESIKYMLDPGKGVHRGAGQFQRAVVETDGFKNTDIALPEQQLFENIQSVQRRQNLPLSDKLIASAGCKVNLDVEMETGTGKTYCYIKTMFEMNKRYGWTKFIVVVPSIAIREGVHKSLQITAEHFNEVYHKKARFFIYNSKNLHELENFSSDAGINVMVINIQAFNATGKDNRRIYEELDDFQSRRPIDVISRNRPILILDEPQKMEGKKTLDSLAKFHPLMIIRYSATHRTTHNKIHRLDALDAYNQKLVKKITVRGITVKGLAGTNAYLFLESIEISKQAPVARIELEVRQASGIKRIIKRLGKGDDLFAQSKELDQYKGFVISQIDATTDTVEFTNGTILHAGDATGDVTEDTLRRIQVRETIKAHLEKERALYPQGIKVLSLFFIDEVAKYRDYELPEDKGEYATIFEEEYQQLLTECLTDTDPETESYRHYLTGIPVGKTHNGYFSIDKKSKRLTNPTFKVRGEEAGLSDDVDAYDLILKDKERLLSLQEPVRFIFSHSALREGWDNPNVFVMCMLKHSDNTISRRQEVGRGLRLCVNQNGDRIDHDAIVHQINILTVVASESYKDFVTNLQREISDALSERPRKANLSFFKGKTINTETGPVQLTEDKAILVVSYLLMNRYSDSEGHIAETYHTAKATGTLAPLPPDLAPHAEQIIGLLDSVFSESQIPTPEDDRKPKTIKRNVNFDKKEFQSLWNRINRKAVYRVEFDSNELITNSIKALDKELKVTPLQYVIQDGMQSAEMTDEQLKKGQAFDIAKTTTEHYNASIHSTVQYDLIGKIAEQTHLTRRTLAEILAGIQSPTFDKYRQNPEHFLSEAARLINEQKATIIIEHLAYNQLEERHDSSIFTAEQSRQDFTKATGPLRRHIYDHVVPDSNVERDFVQELDTSNEVIVYAKLPKGFFIPTPVGNYNPDWAISFKEGTVKHIYFVAETKGSMSTMQLKAIEEKKIECARKFFDEINRRVDPEKVRYDVVTSYGKLMEVVGVGEKNLGDT